MFICVYLFVCLFFVCVFVLNVSQVHLLCGFIMNGVCVKWVGWIDLDSLGGKAKLMFDEEKAKVKSDRVSERGEE